MQLIESDIIRRIDARLAELLGGIFCDDADDLARLNDSVRRFVLAGGKRIRPQLCLWTYGHCGTTPAHRNGDRRASEFEPPDAASRRCLSGSPFSISAPAPVPVPVVDVACAWELFHAFLLAHDDIIDEADSRRGEPSLHRRLAELDGGSLRFGGNLAIVAGDLLFCESMRLLHDLDLPDALFRPVLKLFTRIACTTGYGQAIDICQSHATPGRVREQEVLRQYHWKTAAYTFEGPMLSGALLAGLGGPAQQALSAFALALGQAYQLQNDFIDLGDAAHEGCDLVQGKRTITLLRARSAMPDGQRRSFDDRLQSLRTANGKAVGIAEGLRRELLDAGAAARTRELIGRFLADARAAAADPVLPTTLAEGLGELLDSLDGNYFTP